jgi:hypothetical protein
MIIYRMQNNKGKGCYTGSYGQWTSREHCAPRCPSPEHDGLGIYLGSHLFGFKDLSQLCTWFDHSELLKLSGMGFHIYAIELADTCEVVHGTKQIVFDGEHIISENKLDINNVACYYGLSNNAAC